MKNLTITLLTILVLVSSFLIWRISNLQTEITSTRAELEYYTQIHGRNHKGFDEYSELILEYMEINNQNNFEYNKKRPENKITELEREIDELQTELNQLKRDIERGTYSP
tara:strand:- start:468 stop:797 length:330 start_codon:yes stop_codon:yes gene_type:complete